MTAFSDIVKYSQNKTRVLLFTSQPDIAKLINQILEFSGKDFDFFLNNGEKGTWGHDFVLLETADINNAADFQPNIVLISDDINSDTILSVLKNITPGGVLVYPENIENMVEEVENYFRKLPFSTSEFQQSNDTFSINTEIGTLPLTSNDEDLIRNIGGVKLLCQQFGVMEEDFYEPVMNFK